MEALSIFVEFPWLALAVAGAFALLWYLRRSRAAAIAAVLWTAYAGYEYLMHVRILCSGDCNIRADLLILYPFLLLVSMAAGVSALLKSKA